MLLQSYVDCVVFNVSVLGDSESGDSDYDVVLHGSSMKMYETWSLDDCRPAPTYW